MDLRIMAAAGRSCLTALSHRLMKQLSAAAGDGNLVFAPLSIYSALSLMATSTRGRTLDEFLDLFGTRCCKELFWNAKGVKTGALAGKTQTAYACSVWHDTMLKLQPDYHDAVQLSGGVPRSATDFHARSEEAMNSPLALTGGATSWLINDDDDQRRRRLVQTSAFSLKGSWERPFYRWSNSDDEHRQFQRIDRGVVGARFMTSKEDQFVAVHDGFKVLKLPYALHEPYHRLHEFVASSLRRTEGERKPPPVAVAPRHSLCVFLPDARDGLWRLEDEIASSPEFLFEHLPTRRVEVGQFHVPKFRVSSSVSLKQLLQGIGIGAVFTPGAADMAGMVEELDGSSEPVSVFAADVLHRALIEVDEKGRQALPPAACSKCATRLQPEHRPGCVDFVADHPFVFFVVEEFSGLVLLAGHVLDPTQA